MSKTNRKDEVILKLRMLKDNKIDEKRKLKDFH